MPGCPANISSYNQHPDSRPACRERVSLLSLQLTKLRSASPAWLGLLTSDPRFEMSIDKSLRRKGGMGRNRCVMKRSERILKMMEDGKWTEGQSPFGIPKTRVQKIILKKKKEKVADGDAAAPAADAKGGKK